MELCSCHNRANLFEMPTMHDCTVLTETHIHTFEQVVHEQELLELLLERSAEALATYLCGSVGRD